MNIFELSRKALALYSREMDETPYATETFGLWVLRRALPNLERSEASLRDFAGAQRTDDARLYLVGMLQDNEALQSQLETFLTSQGCVLQSD